MSAMVEALSELLNFPETIEKFVLSSPRQNDGDYQRRGGVISAVNFPADILETTEEYIFFMDVPGLSKSDIQVTIEENTLVVMSNGKRKREDGEEDGCKYIRLERRPFKKFRRIFKLPENANVSAITAKCESGVLTVVVQKLPPPPKHKTVEVTVS